MGVRGGELGGAAGWEGRAGRGRVLWVARFSVVFAEAAFVTPTLGKQLRCGVPGLIQKGNTYPSHCHLEAGSPVFTPLCKVTEISQPFGRQFLTCFFFALNSLQCYRESVIVMM